MRRALVLVLLLCECVLAAPLAERVPADAIVYVGWQGAGAAGGPAYQESRLKQIVEVSDLGQMRDFVKAVAARIGRTDRSAGEVISALIPVSDIVWASPTALYVGPMTRGENGGSPIRAALIIHAGPAAADTAAKLQQVLAKQKTREGLALAVGDYVIVGTGIDDGLTSLVAGRAAGQGALANSPEFQAATGKVASDAAITCFMSVDGLRTQLDKVAGNDWKKWSEALNVKGIRYIAHTAGFEGKEWSSQTFVAAPAPRKGMASLFDQQPLSDDLLRVIPRNSTLVAAGQFDAARLLKETRAALAAGDPQAVQKLDGSLDLAKGVTNVDIERDLLPSLGSEWAMYAAPEIGGSRAMGWVVANRLRDARRAESAMTNMETALSNAASSAMKNGGMHLPVLRVQHGELTVHYLGTIVFSPAWTISNGTLYMGLYPQTVVAAAEAAAAKGPSILDNPVIAAARKQRPAAGIKFVDLPSTANDGYGTALLLSRYVLGFADMTGVQTPMLLVPPLHKLKPLLDPSLAVSWSDEAGWYQRGSEPFPGSIVLSGDYSLGMLMQPGILAAIVIPQFTSASDDARMSATMSMLQTLRSQLELYKLQHEDRVPDFLKYEVWEPMMSRTNEDGVPSPTGKFGPYLAAPPINPLNGFSKVEVVAGPVEAGDTASQLGIGWVLDKSNGRLYATDKEERIMTDH